MISEQSVTKKLDQYKSTLPRRERPCCVAYFSRRTYFNPRSHEGSDQEGFSSAVGIWNFNPRSHEGSDILLFFVNNTKYHFNPRSHEGSDPTPSDSVGGVYDFNPRSHEGSDLSAPLLFLPDKISIHAPTKGATLYAIPSKSFSQFQSTLPRRERHICKKNDWGLNTFQSTLPRRERPEWALIPHR